MSELKKLDAVLQRATDSGEVPGVVAMAATRERVLYHGAFGKLALPSGPAMTEDTVFWIASMTKAITSAAAMQLVERAKLKLDSPIAEVLPELAKPQVLEGFTPQGEPALRAAKRPITLRHLLTHTAGFAYEIWNYDLIRYQEAKGIPGIISCQNAALTAPLVFDPGERWDYGINIDWVGKAVERVSGQKLGDYFRDNFFVPLGMRDTGFKIKPEQRSRLVGMSARQPDGKLEPFPFEVPQEPEFEMGGGGLYGTATDYLAFERMILNGGRANGTQVLKPETVKAMGENQMGELRVHLLKTAMPALSRDAEFFPGMLKKWGFGFMISTEAVPGGRSANSLAWAGLGNTYFWIDPAKGVAGVILAQLVPFADAKVLELFGKLERAVYAELG
jgi:CubicO group peptidase (beta-lactamase class C family)